MIADYAEVLKTQAHTLGDHGLDERQFYDHIFRGAIERIRGQFAAALGEKREFVRDVLNYMQDAGFVREWSSAGEANRHDYTVTLRSGRVAVIELKGCLDGNNTNIFERPPHANEFVIWSVCTNRYADPRRNAWSGIHTRLSAEILERRQLVDGVIIWDMLCGSVVRPCPKLADHGDRTVEITHYRLPPPCIYVFPGTIASPRNNPYARAQRLEDVQLLHAFHTCFGGNESEVNFVDFEVAYRGTELVRRTIVRRGGEEQLRSELTPIRRS